MFKAKLIESDGYYTLRSKLLLLLFIPSLPLGLLISFYQIPLWLAISMLGLYILSIIMMIRYQRKMNLMVGNTFIEISENEIIIQSKKGSQQEIIKLDQINKLSLKDEYSMPQESIKEIGSELRGESKQNYIIIHQDEGERRLDFEIESYFMIKQLNKIIENWKQRGYNIERVSQ